MSDLYSIGTKGEKALAAWLTDQGRKVQPSDKKTFDLIVDGKYAEVKSSMGPYKKLGFISLTQNQFKALDEGVDFTLFVVCNLQDPGNLEVLEISSHKLQQHPPKVESTYYWYKSQFDEMGGNAE